jgi:hypothetical protein
MTASREEVPSRMCWESTLPILISIGSHDDNELQFAVAGARMGYLSEHIDLIRSRFGIAADAAIWFSAPKQSPVKQHLPIGVIADLMQLQAGDIMRLSVETSLAPLEGTRGLSCLASP